MDPQIVETTVRNTPDDARKLKTSYLTNKKINLIKQALIERNVQDIDIMIDVLCEVMKFDPKYADYYAQKSRDNAKALGTTPYELYNQLEYYHKNKDRINARRSERNRENKLKNNKTT